MTHTNKDKEVIIDGVNVAECDYVYFAIDDKNKEIPLCTIGNSFQNFACQGNCYFKQLQRLKEENERKVLKMAEAEVEIEKLQTENEELKEKVKTLEDKLQLRIASDKESDEYWNEIFNDNYPFNKENVYKELSDYYFVLNQIPKIYMEITGGTLSKTTYFASSVIQAHNDALERYYDEIDDLEYDNNAYRSALEEIREIVSFHTSDADNEDVQNDMQVILEKIDEVLTDVDIQR